MLKPFWKTYGEPSAYGVLLLADGDRMGELLDKAQDKKAHQQITVALSEFAGGVAEKMRKYDRHCVYAGGDVVTGAATVILAMGAGKKAAKAMDEYLQNK